MAITATATRIVNTNKATNVILTTGVSETNGTAETFEFVFPAKDESCYIIVSNGNVAAAQVKLLAASEGNGYYESTYSIAKNTICAYALESHFVKASNGKVSVKITPSSSSTVKNSGVNVMGLCSGVTIH